MVNTESRTATVVTVCDNNYVILLAALLKSVAANAKQDRHINFYIVEEDITERNKKRIDIIVKSTNIHIYWLRLDSVIPKQLTLPVDGSTYPLNIYARLFIPHFVPQEVEKVVYLDVDMIVLKDVFDLWNIDIFGYTIAAVHDTFDTAYYGIKNYEELGIPKDSKYFNSGLLMIDTVKWRRDRITEKLMRCLIKYKEYAKYPDQYGLNVIFANAWYELDSRWNTFIYKDEEDPHILHFIGYKPIYTDYDGKRKYYDIFCSYLRQTSWAGYTPKSKYSRYWLKAKTKSKKFLYGLHGKFRTADPEYISHANSSQ